MTVLRILPAIADAIERMAGLLFLFAFMAIGFVAGLMEASRRYDKWLVENGAAQYDSKTGELIYTLEKVQK